MTPLLFYFIHMIACIIALDQRQRQPPSDRRSGEEYGEIVRQELGAICLPAQTIPPGSESEKTKTPLDHDGPSA